MEKSLYELAVEQMESKDIDHYMSDLYLRKNEISDRLIKETGREVNTGNVCGVKTFIDNIDHVTWYEIPFAYTPERC